MSKVVRRVHLILSSGFFLRYFDKETNAFLLNNIKKIRYKKVEDEIISKIIIIKEKFDIVYLIEKKVAIPKFININHTNIEWIITLDKDDFIFSTNSFVNWSVFLSFTPYSSINISFIIINKRDKIIEMANKITNNIEPFVIYNNQA